MRRPPPAAAEAATVGRRTNAFADRTMRIAISGSHATGKSTLLAELAHRVVGLTVIDEPYHLLEEEGYAFATPPTARDFEALVERSIALLSQERRGPVAFDRSPADHLAYLAACRDVDAMHDLPRLVAAVATAMKTLDLVVFVPVERPDRVTGAEAPRLRRRVNELLHAMLMEGAWGFEVPVLEVSGTVAHRLAQIEARVASWGDNTPVTHPAMRAQPDGRCPGQGS